MAVIDRVRDLVDPIVATAGLRLYDVELNGGQLRVTVEGGGDDRGVTLDQLADVNRQISHRLDEEDPISGAYTLEVSSPGLERALRRPEHFVAAVGDEVTVKTMSGVEGDRRVTGTLASADDDGVVVKPADGAERHLEFDQIAKARTVFAWGSTPAAEGTPGPDGANPDNKETADA